MFLIKVTKINIPKQYLSTEYIASFARTSLVVGISAMIGACTDAPDTSAPSANSSITSAAQNVSNDPNKDLSKTTQHALQKPTEYQLIEWTALMPKADLEALSNPPKYLQDVEDGSPEDAVNSQLKGGQSQPSDDPYQQALVSTEIVEDMNNKAVKIPGFVVPLTFNSKRKITEFFLVPYFGACIHLPPPPPNQIIYIKAPSPITLEALYDPFWVSGTITTQLKANEMATAAYSMSLDHIESYEENPEP